MEQKYCQSCGMPLGDESLFGTNQDGSKNQDYCKYCYENGAFTQDVTMEQMIDFCTPMMVEAGTPEAEARRMMQEYFPSLKRWAQ